MSNSATSTNASLKTHAVQAAWLIKFKRKGIRFVAGDDEQTDGVKARYGQLISGLCNDLIDLMMTANGTRSPAHTPSPSLLTDLLSTLLDACRTFNDLDSSLREENSWTIPTQSFLSRILDDLHVVVSCDDRDTSADLLNLIGHPDLRQVKPDLLVGLAPSRIRVAKDAASAPIAVDVSIYIDSRGCPIPYEISQVINAKHYYSYLFCEFKGPNGSTGEGRIQNTQACFIGLQILRTLARMARSADSESFCAPTDTMRRVYGLQTAGSGQAWRLVVMEAVRGFYESEPDVAEEPEGTYSIINIYSGDCTDRHKLAELVAIFRTIGAEAAERADIIGNWLYCLRNVEGPRTPRKRSRAREARMATAGSSPSKRGRPAQERSAAAPGSGEGRSPIQTRAEQFQSSLTQLDAAGSAMYTGTLDVWISEVASCSDSSLGTLEAQSDHLIHAQGQGRLGLTA